MGFKNILLEREGPVYTLTINRPDRMNAISIETVPELLQALSQVGADRDAKVMEIGEGTSHIQRNTIARQLGL